MKNDFNYYFMETSSVHKYPSLKFTKGSPEYQHKRVAIEEELKLIKTESRDDKLIKNPVIGDYHEVVSTPIVSLKMKELFSSLDIFGTQLLPAVVKCKDKVFENYWMLHIFLEIDCIDRDKSEIEYYKSGKILDVEKMVLNQDVLKNIPLEERLIFRLKGYWSSKVVHESLVEKIKEINPSNLVFLNVNDYDPYWRMKE